MWLVSGDPGQTLRRGLVRRAPPPCLLLQVFNGSREMPYTNPRGPVHIITGSAVSRAGKGASGFSPLATCWGSNLYQQTERLVLHTIAISNSILELS